MTLAPRVEIAHLTKRIGSKAIVDDLSFQIPAGEVFGLLGPNGAGKTTTIRMMVGLIAASSGTVEINGLDVAKHFQQAMQHVGAIVENPEMYGFLSGRQNLRHFARMCQGVTEARIEEVVQQVGLEARINDRVNTYSLGMRQRLGLAQALLRRPDVLLLDEPTNGLDPAGIRELRDYLRRLAQSEGLTVVVSSHLLSEMELMCDRVAIIQSGKLVDIQTMGEIAATADGVSEVSLDVDDASAANAVIAARFEGIEVTTRDNELVLTLSREQIPELVAALVGAGAKVYGVRALKRSLEDQFLAMTGGRSVD